MLSSTKATTDDHKEFSRVLDKFDSFFKVRKNVINECARFNRRNQQSGESAEQYIMALYDLAEHCNHGDMRDEMIRNRLVFSIRDAALSEKLQLDPKLTLESAKTAIRQKKAVHEQQQTLKGAEKDVGSVNQVRHQRPRSYTPRR